MTPPVNPMMTEAADNKFAQILGLDAKNPAINQHLLKQHQNVTTQTLRK